MVHRAFRRVTLGRGCCALGAVLLCSAFVDIGGGRAGVRIGGGAITLARGKLLGRQPLQNCAPRLADRSAFAFADRSRIGLALGGASFGRGGTSVGPSPTNDSLANRGGRLRRLVSGSYICPTRRFRFGSAQCCAENCGELGP
jgi:hypothetical protein